MDESINPRINPEAISRPILTLGFIFGLIRAERENQVIRTKTPM